MVNKTRQQIEDEELEKIEKYMKSNNKDDNFLKSKSCKESEIIQDDKNKKGGGNSTSLIYSFIVLNITFIVGMFAINFFEDILGEYTLLLLIGFGFLIFILLGIFIFNCVRYFVNFSYRVVKGEEFRLSKGKNFTIGEIIGIIILSYLIISILLSILQK